ncbi:methyltransferase [Micromonospora sp. NBC_01796]|uniref:methyltransferase n=1 Tax=Micromonospora sp. NBC_01796 TaxID=2975987 RepID=UPI002DD7B360|nr:methyltransferase [Micromonospora sp. NBC_01796]WSA83609.1 methyltransferase [Micromonospora sp. NBC_01796]
MPVPLPPEVARAFMETDEAPSAHLDMLNAISFRTAGAGLRLGVFEELANGPLPVASLAERIGADPLGLRLLLDALVGFGYLVQPGDAYANSENTSRWLLRSTPDSFAPVLSFWTTVVTELWGDLETSVRQGGPTGDFYAWLERRPETLADFQTMLRRLAGWLSEEVITLVPAPPSGGRLLDLGGGHAGYTAAFCQAYPELRATVVDLPGALSQGRAVVESAGLTDRVELRPGDLLTADLGAGYDLVLLFNIVHGYDDSQVAALLDRVAAALNPGGRVVLLEPLAEVPERPPGVADAFVRAFSLNLFHTQGGRAYAFDELAKLLTAAGFGEPEERMLTRSDADHLVIATRT